MPNPLDPSAIERELTSLDGWTLDGDTLRKDYDFADFVAAFAFLTMVALHAERANHHPEITNVYSHVSIGLTSHDAGGVTERDLAMARTLDGL